ncbi:serine protease [Helicobacter turcicus]|uniref:Serine protease n=1 Tax=Helicobacter turcicus TaxID=2867412 RepID=A0ABS7JKI0_9HELI|nr:serine protease [Helicobacter turcicus]MBX7489899.1 serine protease [Helicobacter turcicus]MBX7544759.1 serine protease [Helicobacter turcicus]
MAKVILGIIFALLSVHAKYPEWLQYGVKVIAEFDAPNKNVQQYNEGYGIIINDGLVLTSASVVYDGKRAKDITLYHTEALGEPIACLSHARILAIDDNLDLAVLEAERFTDIYCNVLPEPNFRELSFEKSYFNVLLLPLDLPLDERLEISYFKEHDWSQFLREKIAFKDFLELPQKDKEKLRGMPIFVGNEFLGLKIKESKTDSINSNSKDGVKPEILTHREILSFLCKIERETSVLKGKKNLNAFCNTPLDLQSVP